MEILYNIISAVIGALIGGFSVYFVCVKNVVKQKSSGDNSPNVNGQGNIASSRSDRPHKE